MNSNDLEQKYINWKRFSLLSLVVIGSFASGCLFYGPPPGEGQKAEAYFEKSKTIIKALENYKAVAGKYPDTLKVLVPKYLDQIQWQPDSYFPSGDSYELVFTYEGPGINSCHYSSDSKKWKCRGLV